MTSIDRGKPRRIWVYRQEVQYPEMTCVPMTGLDRWSPMIAFDPRDLSPATMPAHAVSAGITALHNGKVPFPAGHEIYGVQAEAVGRIVSAFIAALQEGA